MAAGVRSAPPNSLQAGWFRFRTAFRYKAVALRLSNTRITALGLKKLAGLPRLKSLDVADRRQVTVEEALEVLTQPAPPQFAVIKEFDKETGIVLYAEWYPSVIKEEAVVPGPEGKQKLEFHRPVTTTVFVRYSVKEGPVYDSGGKQLSAEAALKRISVGMMVLLSTDGKEVHPDFLKVLNKDTLILVPPVQQPSPETARVSDPRMPDQ